MIILASRSFGLLNVAFLGLLLSCSSLNQETESSWCDQPLRPELSRLKEIKTNHPWFKAYAVGEHVFAIVEPYNFQEVISYLIVGSERALLFDTGMGLDSISAVVKELTPLPVSVINSHTHYDHTGGNHEFDHVLAMQTEYTLYWAKNGWNHQLVKQEVTTAALCPDRLPETDTARYHIKPFAISEFVEDGYVLDLGDRKIEVIAVPGHTPDAIALLDRQAGYLWTGDTFYEATIWLFFEGTNLQAYEKSIGKLAELAPDLKRVFPAHNKPIAEPVRLLELKNAFADIKSGSKEGKEQNNSDHPEGKKAVVFEFDNFSFLIRKDFLQTSSK
jgi:glyoxylase-like metal-dependent hydrolase (beta-lactamase superfamily II)